MQSKVIFMKKHEANAICGTLTNTSKMPCKSYSLPTEACQTGYKMAQIKGSICHSCYANKGFYKAYEKTVKPSQWARLDSLNNPHWVDGMVNLIGNDSFFRWHDSGDLQGVDHLEQIARVAQLTPNTRHWLPTREYAMIKQYIAKHGALPKNLIVRLSAMYPDKPVIVPKSLQGVDNVAVSNVHTDKPMGTACNAPKQNGACLDCRLCWSTNTVSYALH
jgi:hypothetical protein